MKLTIRKKGHPALAAISEEVTEDDDLSFLLMEMWGTMDRHQAYGLAANQLGILKRVITINAGGLKQEFVNPVITKHSKATATSRKEGCLSFPGLRVDKVRYQQITVEGFDRKFNPIKRKLKGLTAFAVQHEIDHLNGITIGD